MPDPGQITLFALDCGATNWRLYRSEYRLVGAAAQMLGQPQPAPLTSFIDRRLPAVICLNPAGTALDCFGEGAQQQLDDERQRERVREHFKPCIGAHLEENPLPHQKRYTHAQALEYTRLLLQAVLEQISQEKWRSAGFDDRVVFTFAYPVHWRTDHDGQVFDEFAATVRGCFPVGYEGLRFVAEPEGAILRLGADGSLGREKDGDVTLIVDIGGSTTDIVAGRVGARGGRMEFLGRYGEAFGGGLYDAEIAKVIADELKVPASALADDPTALMSLRVSAQRLKESLSRQLIHAGQLNHTPQRTVTLVMQDGSIYRRVIALDEARFRDITAGLETHFTTLLENALAAMQIPSGEISQVVLVGGGAQLFTIIGTLRQRFGEDHVLLADNPEEIVVQGLGFEYGASLEKIEPTIQFPAGHSDEKPVGEAGLVGGWKLIAADDSLLELPSGVTTVGRGEENDLCLDDVKASRLHAELRVTGDKLEVVDLGSTNGTFLNRERLAPNLPRALTPGDELHFGKTKYVCQR
jgi:molecular chaperone DnaK (HSP70)